MLNHQTKQIVAPIVDGLHALSGRVEQPGEESLRSGAKILPKTKEVIVAVITRLGRRCPCPCWIGWMS